MEYNVRITHTAKYVPNNVVTNDDLSQILDTNDEWIYSRTGIKERHLVQDEDCSDLCTNVAKQLLEKANISANELDFIIVATMTPDFATPSTACLVQGNIGAESALAFDISAACSGFVYALATGEKFLKNGAYQRGIVIGGEVISKIIDWQDRSTAVLFGDGAAGVLLEYKEGPRQFLAECLHSDGKRGNALTAHSVMNEHPFKMKEKKLERTLDYLKMDGREIFDFALRNVSKNILETIEKGNTRPEDVAFVLAHQANTRILDGIAKKIKLPKEMFLRNIKHYGNTSAATIPLLFHESLEQGIIQLGSNQKIVLTGFGGGLTWGSILLSL